LLIGTNVLRALESYKVIISRGEGPYAVKTMMANRTKLVSLEDSSNSK